MHRIRIGDGSGAFRANSDRRPRVKVSLSVDSQRPVLSTQWRLVSMQCTERRELSQQTGYIRD